MPIDPQSISSIGQNTADIGGAVQKAYTLSDAIDRSQMNKMTLASAQEEQANLGRLRSISSKFDLSTAEGQNSYAAEAMKIDPKLGMQVHKMMTEAQRGAVELDSAKLANYKEQNEAWGNILTPAADMIKQGIAAGKTPAEIQMSVMPLVQNGFKTLQAVKLSNGASPIPPEAAAQVTSLLSANDPNVFIKGIMDAATSSEVSRTKLAALEKERMGAANIKSEMEARGNKIETVMKNGKPMRVEFNAKGEQVRILGEAPPTAATVQVGGPNAQSLLGELALRGVNIPARTAGAVVAGLKKNYPGKSDAELADMVVTGQVTLAGVKAEKRVEGAQVGRIETAIREIPQFAEKALAASAKVPRGEFRPFNKLRLYADTELSNPDLKELKSYLNSLSNAYDVAAARGGTDVNKRAEAHAMLDAADSPETLARAIKVMQDEAAIALKAGQSALRGDQPPPAVSGTAPVPSPATGGTGAAGGTQDHGAAMQWAQANPNDPRAQAIMAKAKAAGAQ